MSEKKFAVLLCAEDSDYVKQNYGGYFGVFVSMLSEQGETWEVYDVTNGDFPEDDVVSTYDGFVITRSCSDAHSDDVVWVGNLLNLLKKLNYMKKKVLAICFGHQIIARALGGKIGVNAAGWDIGIRDVNFPTFMSSRAALTSFKMGESLRVIECHKDEIRELPENAEIMAWSSKTGVEMFRYGNHIMGIQGHPEYTKEILLHLIDRLLQRNLITESLAEEAKANMEGAEPDREAWKQLCINFLKGRSS